METYRRCIDDILSSRQLTHVSGNPLYSYKLSETEYLTLQQSLVDSLRGKSLSVYVPTSSLSVWAGAFVLYASEWWRKQFSGGYWSWEPIFHSLGVVENDINATQRNKLIAAGFYFWHRPILSNGQGRMFLGSIAIEGGLPLTLLTDPQSKLANYFEHVINDFSKYALSAPNAVAIAQAHDHWIAESFRTEAVYSVVGKIAEVIYHLAEQYDLDGQTDPLRYLDAEAPDWLDKLPLNLETETARVLLCKVFGQAIALQRRMPDSIKVERRLVPSFNPNSYLADESESIQTTWRCSVNVTMRSRLHVDYVQQTFGMDSLPEHLNIFVVGQKPQLIAKAFRPKNNPTHYLLEMYDTRLPSEWFDCEIQLLARGNDGSSWQAPLVGGAELAGEEPWVFVESNNEWIFAGAGEVSCEATTAMVSSAAQNQLVTESGNIKPVSSESVLGLPLNRSWCVIEGADTYLFDDYQIVLGSDKKQRIDYVWKGNMLPFQSLPTKCYIGKPKLIAMSEQGMCEQIESSKLVWHDLVTGQWQPFSTLPFGEVEVAYLDRGKAKKRFRLAHLPSDFKISFLPGNDIDCGKIAISTSYPPMIAISNIDSSAIEGQVNQVDSGVVIHTQSTTEFPPALLQLSMWWQDKPKAIALTLPFPSRGVCVVDRKGKLIDPNQSLLVDNLNQYEIYGYGLEGAIAFNFSLSGPDVRGGFARTAYFTHRFSSVDALSTGVSMSVFRRDIQALFSLSSHLDAKVQVTVQHNSRNIYAFSFALYERNAIPEKALNRVIIEGELDADDDSYHLFTVPLDHPAQMPLALKSIAGAEPSNQPIWALPEEAMSPGAWLIYCDKPELGIRPVMWSQSLENIPAPQNELERAAVISSKRERLEAFRQIAETMAVDFQRPEWQYVRSLLEFKFLPLTTFNFWHGAIRVPEFIFALLLKANKNEIEQVWDLNKQFPLFWYSLKVDLALKVAKSAYKDLILRLDGGEEAHELAIFRIQKRLKELVSYFPGLSALADFILFQLETNNKKPSLAVPAYMQCLFEERNKVSQRQSDVIWPTVFANEIFNSLFDRVNQQLRDVCFIKVKDYKYNLLNVPVLLALSTVNQSGLQMSPEIVHALREYRRFDPEYFDESFLLTQKMAIGLLKI